jgi:hypothetical protein
VRRALHFDESGQAKTPRAKEQELLKCEAEWAGDQEESRVGLLEVSVQRVSADSLSTRIIGVAHFGQRKQESRVEAEPVAWN